jgi:hypothetical protein
MLLPTLATSLLLATAVSASPVVEQSQAYPEVIPGEGLPSLTSLGLTSAELYETSPHSATSKYLKYRPLYLLA